MKQLGSFEPEKRKEIGQKLNAIQKEVLEAIENAPEQQILRSNIKQEEYHLINLLVSKSVLWRKKLTDDVLYGKKPNLRR